jgi:hypothetical protein
VELPEKTAIVVLGMHRSGTSSIAGSFVKLGASAPKSLLTGREDNERGFFESAAILWINEEILASADSDWDDWQAFDHLWLKGPRVPDFEKGAAAALASEFGSSNLVVIKDPRICRIAPFWFKVLEQSNYAVRVVIPLRNPLEVAESLQARDGFPIDKGLLLWLRHTLDAELFSRDKPRTVVYWPDLLSDWRAVTEQVSERIGVSWPNMDSESGAEVDQFLSPSLRHFSAAETQLSLESKMNDLVRLTFEAMIDLANKPNSMMASKTLDAVRVEFERGSQIFGGALNAMQAYSKKVEVDMAKMRAERDAAFVERDKLLMEITTLQRVAASYSPTISKFLTPNEPGFTDENFLFLDNIFEKRNVAVATAPMKRAHPEQLRSTAQDVGEAISTCSPNLRQTTADASSKLEALKSQAEALRHDVELLRAALVLPPEATRKSDEKRKCKRK